MFCQEHPGIYLIYSLFFGFEKFEVGILKLSTLIKPLIVKQERGDMNTEIRGIQIDSREVKPGDLFIARTGFAVDGHDFIDHAIENGAVALLVQKEVSVPVPTVLVPDTQRALSVIAANFYGYPSKELTIIGVTGTNGKTTTTHLIEQILSTADHHTGIIGTTGVKIFHDTYPTPNTTPESSELQRVFRMMRNRGLHYVSMEVSSHALDLGRTRGVDFDIAVFTNLTQDHLDYHQTMENYREAKGLLFSQLGNYNDDQKSKLAILNADDPASSYFARITSAQVITYGLSESAMVRAEQIRITSQGTSFRLHTFKGSIDISWQLLGKFNVYNALAAAAVALGCGCTLDQIQKGLAGTPVVEGRFEWVKSNQPFTVLVDYAHTPDSLENALTTIREFAQNRVICVVGCGGDRDRKKRPLMAKVVEKYSDLTVITSDNPRSEPPEKIIEDMIQGLTKEDYVVRVDRKEAIQFAIEQAELGDVVLIAGKGHETYQEIQGVRYPFDDREVARSVLERKKGR